MQLYSDRSLSWNEDVAIYEYMVFDTNFSKAVTCYKERKVLFAVTGHVLPHDVLEDMQYI